MTKCAVVVAAVLALVVAAGLYAVSRPATGDDPPGFDPQVYAEIIDTLYGMSTLEENLAADAALLEMGHSATPYLVRALKHHDDCVRSWAAVILEQTEDPSAAPALVEALDDPYPDGGVALAAADALMVIKSRDVLPQLVEKTLHGPTVPAWLAAHVVDAVVEEEDFGMDDSSLMDPFVSRTYTGPDGDPVTLTGSESGRLDKPLAAAREAIARWWAKQGVRAGP